MPWLSDKGFSEQLTVDRLGIRQRGQEGRLGSSSRRLLKDLASGLRLLGGLQVM